MAHGVDLGRPRRQVAGAHPFGQGPQAAASVTPVTVTTVYAAPLPCARCRYHNSRASSVFPNFCIQPSRKAASKASSFAPAT